MVFISLTRIMVGLSGDLFFTLQTEEKHGAHKYPEHRMHFGVFISLTPIMDGSVEVVEQFFIPLMEEQPGPHSHQDPY